MGNELLGYSLALFGGKNSTFHYYADEADKKGNNNGLIDNKEEESYFKQQIKSAFNYDFSFDNIKKAHKEHLSVWEKGDHSLDYYDFAEISRDYKVSLTKTLKWLNPNTKEARVGQDYVNLEGWKQNGVTIANMSEKDYKESVEAIQSQIKEIEERDLNIEKAKDAKTNSIIAKIQKQYGEQYQVTADKAFYSDWDRTVTITLKGSKTLGQIKNELKLDEGVLIKHNPELKKASKPTFAERIFNTRNLDEIMVTDVTIKLPVNEINL